METRLTPAAAKPAKRLRSTAAGLASSVISASRSRVQTAATAATIALTVSGGIRLGVPPPKKILVIRRAPILSA